MAFPLNSAHFSDAVLILGTAGIVIPIFTRVRVSPVIGFILVGILVGPHGLGALVPRAPWLYFFTITDTHAIEPYAEFGIVLLLFTIGMELSFKRLWLMRRMVLGLGVTKLLVSAAAIGALVYLLGQPTAGALGLGLALALSSTALVLPMVNTTSIVGTAAFAMLLLEDLALVPIIFTLGTLAPYAADPGWEAILRAFLVGTAVIVSLIAAGYFLLPRLFAQAARAKSPELFLSVSLLVVIMSAIATTAAGLSPIVGALLSGMLIAETEYRHQVETIIEPFKGLALGVFLLTVGMSIDLRQILAEWDKLAMAVVAVVTIKALVTAGLLRLAGNRRGMAAETGLLMSSPSETTLIVLSAAAGAQLIQPSTANFWQTVTAIGLTITPMLARIGRDAARRVERREAVSADPEHAEEGPPRAIIIGFGRVGQLIADMLDVHGRPWVAVESDIDAVTAARAAGRPVIFGDAARTELIERLHLDSASALVLTMDDPVQQVRLTRRARRDFPRLTIVARARDGHHAAELYRAGATDAVPEQLESSLQLSEAVLVDLGVAMGPVIASIHEKRAAQRAEIMALGNLSTPPVERGRRLRDAAG
ncbi:cation:proton antiporter domain-containing protein [Sphingomonas quercus]|uniref:Cation:proton antiporter n=1 Tax=Sphingomonas quercus TaxID=2842451 RepID=A0ABS6BGB4_9SPHN|nr:cation:proton antiporter [Sphingomonas quercus]MBU3076285.1 cation:proton antiporter [Sphingomonas quercus]